MKFVSLSTRLDEDPFKNKVELSESFYLMSSMYSIIDMNDTQLHVGKSTNLKLVLKSF